MLEAQFFVTDGAFNQIDDYSGIGLTTGTLQTTSLALELHYLPCILYFTVLLAQKSVWTQDLCAFGPASERIHQAFGSFTLF